MAKTIKKMQVSVIVDEINYPGKVRESTVIAQFSNMAWAENFIKQANDWFKNDTDLWRVRVEVKD